MFSDILGFTFLQICARIIKVVERGRFLSSPQMTGMRL